MKTRTKSPECLDVDGKIITNFSDQNALIGSEFKLFDFDYWDPKSLILDPVNISKNEDGYYPASV